LTEYLYADILLKPFFDEFVLFCVDWIISNFILQCLCQSLKEKKSGITSRTLVCIFQWL